MNEELFKILKIEGIVIRLIPKINKSLYNENYYKGKSNQRIFYHDRYKRNMCEEITENSLGGKYIISIEYNQDSTIRQNKNNVGIGNTIEIAYQDFLIKNTKKNGGE
jgi:hypothetical protein